MELLTPWGEALDPEQVMPEHPRPQMERERWLNLNGHWDHAFTGDPVPSAAAASASGAGTAPWPGPPPASWDGPILVPFSPETPLSGVGRRLEPGQTLWYRRTVTLPEGWRDQRLLLHFGAVDQECAVLVDGAVVGGHVGGFTPFTLEIDPSDDVVELVVAVRDDTDSSHHSRGKQRLDSGGIWYSGQSGIWQQVWLEPVPRDGLDALTLTPRLRFDAEGVLQAAGLEVAVHALPGAVGSASVVLSAAGTEVSRTEVVPGRPALLEVEEPRLWSPEDPFLYDLEVSLGADRVRSYAGLRSFGVGPDAAGIPRLLLNGRPCFVAGLLDQGYWSDGWLTAPSDAALLHDIELARSMGFTMLRKHIKLEPARWYHHCDRLGMLVWQDLVNGGRSYRPEVITLPALLPLRLEDTGQRAHRRFGREDAEGRAQFEAEMVETVQHLRNVPSLAAWVVFNEGWGQFDAAEMAERMRKLDDTRVIDHASGWYDQGGGDVRSLHVYFRPFRLRRSHLDGRRPVVLSEYGGYSLRIPGHVTTDKRFGYKRLRTAAALQGALSALHREQIAPAIPEGLSAIVYTQLSDVEDEDNGLTTYDRRVLKVDPAAMREVIGALRLPPSSTSHPHQSAATAARDPRRIPTMQPEREITAPVSLTGPDGGLNPGALGFTRTQLHDTSGIGACEGGRRRWGRNKRWEYWNVTTPRHILAVTVSHVDYIALHAVWLLDRVTGEVIQKDAIIPLGLGAQLPGSLGTGTARGRAAGLELQIEELGAEGTRLVGSIARLSFDVIAHRPAGHEAMGVVVPWRRSGQGDEGIARFQYTVKDVARPASGVLVIDGIRHEVPEGSWAVLDHGRGRWPYRVHWNWAAGSGTVAGRRIGLQLGAKWTDGSGATENALVVDGMLSKISEELHWDYDPAHWMRPWRVTGRRADLTLTPFHHKHSSTQALVISSRTDQLFGTWSGWVLDDQGEKVAVDGIEGFAEDVLNRW